MEKFLKLSKVDNNQIIWPSLTQVYKSTFPDNKKSFNFKGYRTNKLTAAESNAYNEVMML